MGTGFEDRDLIPALQAFIRHDNAEGLIPVLTTTNLEGPCRTISRALKLAMRSTLVPPPKPCDDQYQRETNYEWNVHQPATPDSNWGEATEYLNREIAGPFVNFDCKLRLAIRTDACDCR